MKRLTLALLGVVVAALLLAGPASAIPVELPSQTFNGHETAAGSFAGVPQVAVDETTGDVFVLDSQVVGGGGENHDVIDRFHFDGTAWKPVAEIKGSETTAGSFGLNGGKEASLKIDQTSGHLYVSGALTNNVFAFEPSSSSPSGYQGIWEKEPFASTGQSLSSITVDPGGQLWAASQGGGMLKRLSAATGEPTAELSITEPRRIAFDSTGTLYVLSTSSLSNGIDKYVGGSYVETFDSGSVNTDLATEAGTGNLFSGGQTLKEWDSSGNQLAEVARGGSGFYWSFAVDAAHHRLFVGESTPQGESPAVRVYELQPDLTLNLTGQGSVECEVEGGEPEPCASSYPFGTKVKLIAGAESGSIFAGWLGCKHAVSNTCEVTMRADTEVAAVFLEKGQSVTVTPEPAGVNCPNGGVKIESTLGVEYVCNGSNGANGANGQNGASGPEGKQGPQGPAGKVSVTCKVKQKGKKVKVTCTVKQSASASSAHWRLMRAGRAYRHGIARHGRLRLANLSAGHYRLYVEGKKGATEIIVG